jgi:N-methylhydantoinase B
VGHSLSVCGTIISGTDPERGQFVLVEPQAGGWGATTERDGESGLVVAGDGETYVMPVEVCEQRYPILVEQFAYNTMEQGGMGRFRGGLGLVRDYRIVCPEAELTATFGRHRFPAWGAEGGAQGSPNAVEVFPVGAAHPALRAGKVARHRLDRGEVVRLITGSGGGIGDAWSRDPLRVELDIRNDVITPEQARTEYGVVWDPSRSAVDLAATLRLRQVRASTDIKE